MLLLAVAMTGSDLSASAKPWPQQIRTVRVIFDEFYQQVGSFIESIKVKTESKT